MSDYKELALYLEEDQTVNLWIHLENNKLIFLKDVTFDPVHYQGVWTISYHFLGQKCTALIPSDNILYFTVYDAKVTENVTLGDEEMP
jgi:WD40 repeat protein